MGTKFTPRKIDLQNSGSVFIVGQNPPRKQRQGCQNYEVFHGTRTGDFIEGIIKDHSNIYLTNICNWQEMNKETVQLGAKELIEDIHDLQPSRVIILGEVAKKIFVKRVLPYVWNIPYITLPHPSWTLRFNQDKVFYSSLIINYLNNELFKNERSKKPGPGN